MLQDQQAPTDPSAAPGSGKTGDDASQEVPLWGQIAVGTVLVVLGVALLALLVGLWPTIKDAADNTAGKTNVTWFNLGSYSATPDAALLILVVLASALGSYVHAATSFADYIGNRKFARSWIWWYMLRLFVGTSLAVLVYFAIRGGFFTGSGQTAAVNPYGIAAISGLVGLFSKQATDKLREIFDTAFRVAAGYGDDARGDGIANPVPVLDASEPERLVAGKIDIDLIGSGFTSSSTVRVSLAGGAPVPRKVTYVGPQRLRVALEEADVDVTGVATFTVVNPAPGGGQSAPLTVKVEPPQAEA